MLKKLLYLYNDGHNPFPHMKGKGFGFIPDPNHPDRMDLQYYADDQMTQEEADRLNGILPELEEEYEQRTGNLAEIERLYPERFIPTVPTKQEYDIEKYREEYDDDDAEIFGYDDEEYDDDERLQEINEELYELKVLRKKMIGDMKSSELEESMVTLEKELENNEEQKNNIVREMNKLVSIEIKKYEARPAEIESKIASHALFGKIMQKIVISFSDYENENKLNTQIVNSEIEKYAKIMKVDIYDLMDTMAGHFLRNSKAPNHSEGAKKALKLFGSIILMSKSNLNSKYNELKSLVDKIDTDSMKINEKYIESKKKVMMQNTFAIKIIELQKEYAERKKVLDSKRKVSINKQQGEISHQDLLEIQAEQKEKEALASGKQLSKAAHKKANAAAKKAVAEKQAETPVVNALSSLSSKGTYGKKLEEFFASQNGQPILQKFTGDTSKIKDIEKDEIIPDEEVMFDDGTTNSLRKACTLDLYNNKFVFEIKNYVNNSIEDDIIPMQPSKFAGTKYFVPRYLEDGSLYSLNLNYTSPKTGKHYTQNVLPPDTHGREVVFVIRLKEGLFQYKPFLDHENTKLIPSGEFVSGKRPLYFFDSTKLKKCKDYNGKPAFNLKGHLTPI